MGYKGTKEFALVYCHLIIAAINQKTVFYNDISNIMFGRPIGGPGMAHSVGSMLDEINNNESYYERPILSSTVVSEVTDIPGDGYFICAKELGKLARNTKFKQEKDFFKDELKKVYSTWKHIVAEGFHLQI